MLTRQREHELMDDPSLDEAAHAHALSGLARLNTMSGAAPILWTPIRRLLHSRGMKSVRILDIATGSADVPLHLWQLARYSGIDAQIDGCDMSETAIAHAQERAHKLGAKSRFFKINVNEDDLPSGYDVITNSLFLHHLSEQEAVSLLRKMAAATNALVLVSDLERSVPSLAMVTLASRLLTTSYVVHNDAPASVRSAYNVEELRRLAEQANLPGAKVNLRFPCRMLLTWSKPHGA